MSSEPVAGEDGSLECVGRVRHNEGMVVKVGCTPRIRVLCRWKGGNGPEQTDSIATGNLIKATPKGIKRFVLVTSAGVERYNKLPFSILNLFGTLLTPLTGSSLPFSCVRS
jgi:hypothetical protein